MEYLAVGSTGKIRRKWRGKGRKKGRVKEGKYWEKGRN